MIAPLLQPRRDAAPADGGQRWRWLTTRWSYVIPIALWSLASVAVQVVARGAASVHGGFGIAWSDLLGHPLSTEPYGRIGWGTGDYWLAATHLYDHPGRTYAIFPGLPLALRAVRDATGWSLEAAQVAVASVSGLVSAVAMWGWTRGRGVAPRVGLLATVLILVWPWSFVLFGYGYSDPTLLACVLVALACADRSHPVLAGIVGAVATSLRPNAVVVVPTLVVLELVRTGALDMPWPGRGAWRDIRWRRRALRPASAGVLLSLAGVAAYSTWLGARTGNPLAWLEDQGDYGHGSVLSPATWAKVTFIGAPGTMVDHVPRGLNELASAIVIVGAVVLVPAAWRRLGPDAGVLLASTTAIAWVGTRGFAPAGRYLLPALPVLAVVGAEWLDRRPWLARLTVVAFALASLVLVVLFPLGGELWLEW